MEQRTATYAGKPFLDNALPVHLSDGLLLSDSQPYCTLHITHIYIHIYKNIYRYIMEFFIHLLLFWVVAFSGSPFIRFLTVWLEHFQCAVDEGTGL